jgi:prepilin-type N-terminal cleavage/methylation domain-containing protein
MSTNSIRQKQKGFTIIEVVLVLAIAGLIFLIVFLALPQLQKSRRDTQRKNDVGRILSGLESYASNNSGAYPDASQIDAFTTNYIGTNKLNDPSGGAYALKFVTTAPTNVTNGNLTYESGATCGANGTLNTGASVRSIAVAVQLETGGFYCQQNN